MNHGRPVRGNQFVEAVPPAIRFRLDERHESDATPFGAYDLHCPQLQRAPRALSSNRHASDPLRIAGIGPASGSRLAALLRVSP